MISQHRWRLLAVYGLIGAAALGDTPVLRIDAGHPGVAVSPSFYGLMTEEINHSYDGGLYAELIRNRSLGEDAPDAKAPSHWTAVQDGGAQASITIDPSQPLNAAQTRSLRLDIAAVSPGQRAGVANEGYWGMAVRAGDHYRASFYAKAAAGFHGPLVLTLEAADGSHLYAAARVKNIGPEWKRYEAVLVPKTGTASAANRFVISAAEPGTVWLQMVSLFPPTWHDRSNGNRVDLMRRMADLHPAFLRFPGGNYLEGNTVAERFDWKKTIGDVADRPGHPSPWKYWSTDGLGLLEFLEWCEDLRMQPVLAIYAGYSLRHVHVPPGPELQPYVQDALDEIEYVTGGPETTWGARRIKDGHAAPFALTYLEVGNEDWFDRTGSYDGRFAQFYDAIKAKYPKLQLIATTAVKSRRPDVVDEHFYKKAAAFYAMTRRYDAYDRWGPKIFVGEWATREGSPTPNLNAALGDFAWMTGLERNSDLVIMNSYAPLLVNVSPGAMQWRTDLIGFDAVNTYGSPSYYAQAMFNGRQGRRVLPAQLDAPPGFFYSVTGTGGLLGRIFLKAANTTDAPLTLQIEIDGKHVGAKGTEIVLASDQPTDTNSIDDPTRIVPHEHPLEGTGGRFEHTFPAYSDTVIELTSR